MPEEPEDTPEVIPEHMQALTPHYRYLLEEVLEVLPVRDVNHLRVLIHRYRHLLSPAQYAYGHRGRRSRLLSIADIETLTRVYKPKVDAFLRLISRWASAS